MDNGRDAGQGRATFMPATTPTRDLVTVDVGPDQFEVAVEDVVLVASLDATVAVCLYDAVEEPGALLHLRFVARGAAQLDVTDRTLATDLLLLDRCVESLRQAAPKAGALQGKVLASVGVGAGAALAAESVLNLVGAYLADAGITIVSTDVDAEPRRIAFRPMMGQVRIGT